MRPPKKTWPPTRRGSRKLQHQLAVHSVDRCLQKGMSGRRRKTTKTTTQAAKKKSLRIRKRNRFFYHNREPVSVKKIVGSAWATNSTSSSGCGVAFVLPGFGAQTTALSFFGGLISFDISQLRASFPSRSCAQNRKCQVEAVPHLPFLFL